MAAHLYNLCALCLADVAVVIDVVHLKRPAQSIHRVASRRHAQRRQKLAEIQPMIVVFVERSKHVFGKLRRVAVRKVLHVDVLELIDAQLAAGKVALELFVPASDFVLGEAGVLGEV